MTPNFLQAYLEAFHEIEGWFDFNAALLFMAYAQLLRKQGVAGHVLEIGVHHGLSAIAVATLRGPGKLMFAVDLFDRGQSLNISHSGAGNLRIFEANMRRFHPDLRFLRTYAKASSALTPSMMGNGFSFCNVDGGHSRAETYGDLRLCSAILVPGGIVALDDYFNPEFPGVCEGATQFMLEHPGTLRPLAIAYNKALFQRLPATQGLNADLARVLPQIRRRTVSLWDSPAFLITSPLRSCLDLHASTPERFVFLKRAEFTLPCHELHLRPAETIALPVGVTNVSQESFPHGEWVLGLSYHLLSHEGGMLRHDHERAWFMEALAPGQTKTVDLTIEAPGDPGQYQIEVDLVWEGVMWFKDVGNATACVPLTVE